MNTTHDNYLITPKLSFGGGPVDFASITNNSAHGFIVINRPSRNPQIL